jgi:hypothetical protein
VPEKHQSGVEHIYPAIDAVRRKVCVSDLILPTTAWAAYSMQFEVVLPTSAVAYVSNAELVTVRFLSVGPLPVPDFEWPRKPSFR